MKGKIQSLNISLDGKQILTLQIDGDFRSQYNELSERNIEVTIKPYKQKRSLNANAYFWTLCGVLAEKLNKRTSEIYKELIIDIGGNHDIVCVKEDAVKSLTDAWARNGLGWQTVILDSKIQGCKNVVLYYGSSTYDTKQMARLIDVVVAECKEQGIETMTPQELDRLKTDWGKN